MKSLPVILILMASTAYGEIYTWKDSRGTAHYANSEYDIPERYRSRAKVLDLGIEQKGGNPPLQQSAPLQPGEQVTPVNRSQPPAAEVTDTNQRRPRPGRHNRRDSSEDQ
jgi:hypothetical protein